MRLVAAAIFAVCICQAQFKTTVPLVVAPTLVSDARGRSIDGLTEHDLILYDNNVPQPVQLDFGSYPISLVIAVQTGGNSGAVIDKLGGSGILFADLLAAEAGETALISFSDQIRLHQDFTSNPDLVAGALKKLRVEGGGACALDAVEQALRMLAARKTERRRIVFVIGEKRDRSSSIKLPDVVRDIQRQNAAIYWLTYSPSLTPYTARPKTVKSDNPKENGQLIPYDPGPMNIFAAFTELAHLTKPNLADLLSRTSGGRTMNFLKRSGLEDEIQAIGREVHSEYILSFQPPPSEPGGFHSLRVEVKGRPDVKTKTRTGYWAVN